MANIELATQARELADRAPRGSIERKAAGCAAIALAESSTIAGSRKVLSLLWQDGVRQAATDLINQLASQENE